MCVMTESADVSETTLRQALCKHDEYFRHMIDLIPPDFYFGEETRQKLDKRHRQDSDDSEDETTGGRTKNKGTEPKLKKGRHGEETISQIQADLLQTEKSSNSDRKKGKKKKEKRLHTLSERSDSESELKTRTDSIEDLRQRLQAKIEILRKKRKALPKEENRQKQTLKRQAKKMKLKLKKVAIKQNKHPKGFSEINDGTNTTAKPVYNKEGKMVFSKFDFKESEVKKPEKEPRKNLKKLLEQVTKKKEKMAQLKEMDPEAARKMQEKTSWQAAISKSQGIKVKDNPELIKKSIKRKEKLKKKSQKAWDERKTQVQKRMEDRQEKRRKNIQKKKEGRTKTKINKAKKKGRIIPGF